MVKNKLSVGARCSVPPQGRHNRRSIRIKEYDYSQPGGYFITICSHNKECVFGNIIDGNMNLNEFGRVIEKEWIKTFYMRQNLKLDEYVVMPNHLHGIIIIYDGRGTLQRAPTFEHFGKPISNSIPTIVRLFKSATTKQINQIRQTPGMELWQRNYYEHIIRNEDELNQIREYIVNNPLRWEFDRENPQFKGTSSHSLTGPLQRVHTNNQWVRLEEKIHGKPKQ